MDEPSLGLAPILVSDTFKMITKVNETGIPILLIEQNARKALQVASRGYVLGNGKIIFEGDSKSLRSNDEVRAAYLGG